MKSQKSLQGVRSEEKVRQCPDCGSTDIVNGGDELYCRKCGLVID